MEHAIKDESCIEESPNPKEGNVSEQQNHLTQQVKVNDPSSNILEDKQQLRMSKDLKPIQKSYHSFTQEEANKITNGIVMVINQYASQLFEMHNNIFKLISFKPRRIYKHLARDYQNRIERLYGENILRHVVFT
jgi:hypothetical protein